MIREPAEEVSAVELAQLGVDKIETDESVPTEQETTQPKPK